MCKSWHVGVDMSHTLWEQGTCFRVGEIFRDDQHGNNVIIDKLYTDPSGRRYADLIHQDSDTGQCFSDGLVMLSVIVRLLDSGVWHV